MSDFRVIILDTQKSVQPGGGFKIYGSMYPGVPQSYFVKFSS